MRFKSSGILSYGPGERAIVFVDPAIGQYYNYRALILKYYRVAPQIYPHTHHCGTHWKRAATNQYGRVRETRWRVNRFRVRRRNSFRSDLST